MANNNAPTVALRTSSHNIMAPRWNLLRHVLGGTEAMRSAGTAYLPRHQEESPVNYGDRLTATTLLNMTELVSDTLVGRVFKVPLEPQPDIPEAVKAIFEDVDLTGTGLNPFCRDWFEEGLNMGLSHVLVEMQSPQAPTAPGVPRTRADDAKENLRPYWYRVSPESIIAAFAEQRNGRQVLTHVRIAELAIERSGFSETPVLRVRVLEEDHWEVWEPTDKDKQGPDDEWTKIEEGPNGLGLVPLVTFQTGRAEKGTFVVKPPLLDLAYLNVAHWQSSSDQRSILTVARFPILACSGLSTEDAQKIKVGPREYLTTPESTGKWYYVEHRGAAIKAGQSDLDKLEDAMASYGAEFLRSKPGTRSATERLLNEAGTISPLEAMALDFQDCLGLVLQITAAWADDAYVSGKDLPDGGVIRVVVDTTTMEIDQVSLEALFRARAARDISREAYLGVLKNRGVLDEDFDHKTDLELLAKEPEFGMPERGVDENTAPGVADDKQPAGGKGPGAEQDTPGGNTTPSKGTGASNLPSVKPMVTKVKLAGRQLPANQRRSAIAGRDA